MSDKEKIKLVRFMSKYEFEQYLNGCKLENYTNWKADQGRRSGSVGFCFFPYDEKPEEMMAIMTGIAAMEKVIIVETEEKNVRKSFAKYRDDSKDMASLAEIFAHKMTDIPLITKTEYCTTSYSMDNFRLLKVGNVLDPWMRKIDWYWRTGSPVRLSCQ